MRARTDEIVRDRAAAEVTTLVTELIEACKLDSTDILLKRLGATDGRRLAESSQSEVGEQ